MKIVYESDGREIEAAGSDKSLLELSLAAGIPHMHTCGGRARCSTCRVAVLGGGQNLSAPTEAELMLARRKGWDVSCIRLACQARPLGDAAIRRLVADEEDVRLVGAEKSSCALGRELELAVLFSDLEDFTSFAESALPYDVIHVLDRYFNRMGEVVLRNGGLIDKYVGDGLMAIFGFEESDPKKKCESAVRAALEMLAELDRLNPYFERQFGRPFRSRIGVHFGRMIGGEFGHPSERRFTVLGDAVNVASRIEAFNKRTKTSLLVSADVYEQVKGSATVGARCVGELKGKTGNFELFEIKELRAS